MNTSFVNPGREPLMADEIGINLLILNFTVGGKLSIIRCDKQLLPISLSLLKIRQYI